MPKSISRKNKEGISCEILHCRRHMELSFSYGVGILLSSESLSENILKNLDVTIDITTRRCYTLVVIEKVTINYLGGIHHEDCSGMCEW